MEISFILQNKDQTGAVTAESKALSIQVRPDSKYPDAVITDPEPVELTPLESLAKTLSFGLYQKTGYAVKATVTDEGAGVKNWQYAVIDGDKDMTSAELEALIYPDSGESQIKWTEGTNGAEITRL